MDERTQFKLAYDEWVRARAAFDAWMRAIFDGNASADVTELQRLALDCQSALQEFMSAAQPFIFPKG